MRLRPSGSYFAPSRCPTPSVAFGWLGDPVVMRFTPAGADNSSEETKARLAGYVEHQKAVPRQNIVHLQNE
jgi:hypothetical protein